jgi:hypothetical protein
MPHYWFRVPLSGTADHLKRAKQTGGAPKVKQELKKDARTKGKSLKDAFFAPDMSACDAIVESDDDLTPEECSWFQERWDTGEQGCPEPRLEADETVLEPESGWIRDPGTSD